MYRSQQFIAYDRQLLVSLIGLWREAKRAPGQTGPVLREIQRMPEPPVTRSEREQAAARLTWLREMRAPWIMVRNHLMVHDTKGYLVRRLERGRAPSSWVFGQLAVRQRVQVDDSLYFGHWLVDAERRKPEHVLTPEPNEIIDFSLLNLPKADTYERRQLFGSIPFRLGATRPKWLNASGIQPCWHDASGCSEAAAFLERALGQSPPPLSDFALCYPQLFALRYAMSGHPDGIPSKAHLEVEYARFVTRARRVLKRLLRLDLACARRGWSRRSLVE